MRSLLSRPLSWAALTVLLGFGWAPSVLAGGHARVEIDRGRGILLTDLGVLPMTVSSQGRTLDGPGHFELAPGSVGTLRLGGRGSLRIQGPGAVHWEERPDTGELRLGFDALHGVDVEVRTQGMRLDLPGGWRLQLGVGAVSVHALPGGGTELINHAGHPASIQWTGGEGLGAPARPVRAGERARLQGVAPLEKRPDQTGDAPRWSESEWPWGDGGIPNLPDIALDPVQAWDGESWPWDPVSTDVEPWERWDWPWTPSPPAELATEQPRPANPSPLEPATGVEGESWTPREPLEEPLPVEPTPAPEELPEVQAAPRPEPVDPPVEPEEPTKGEEDPSLEPPTTAKEPVPVDPEVDPLRAGGTEPEEALGPSDMELGFHGYRPAAFEPEFWRHLPGERIMWNRGYALQRSPFLVFEELPQGRRRIHLKSDAPEPVWFFNSRLDLRVFPGSTLLIESTGSMRSYEGLVRTLFRHIRREF